MSAVMTHKGRTVAAVDINPEFVKAINEGRPPVNEPGLAEMIAANRGRLSTTESFLATDVMFVIVPTPGSAAHEPTHITSQTQGR